MSRKVPLVPPFLSFILAGCMHWVGGGLGRRRGQRVPPPPLGPRCPNAAAGQIWYGRRGGGTFEHLCTRMGGKKILLRNVGAPFSLNRTIGASVT